MFKILLKAVVIVIVAIAFAVSPAFAAGTNLSSGISWTVGHSSTNVTEFSDYSSHGCGISISHESNSDGFDYRREVYNTSTKAGSVTKGIIRGNYTSMDHTSSAGILRSSTGIQQGVSKSNMKTKSWGKTKVNGDYVQLSSQDNSVNYEYGSFNSSSGYNAETYAASYTRYENSYTNTEFDY
ncbi:MAG: hypothetical protein K0U78_15365 [Actinomycetia bacterium]|nr:hypothetical protein [Actinomycetes bacterium]